MLFNNLIQPFSNLADLPLDGEGLPHNNRVFKAICKYEPNCDPGLECYSQGGEYLAFYDDSDYLNITNATWDNGFWVHLTTTAIIELQDLTFFDRNKISEAIFKKYFII